MPVTDGNIEFKYTRDDLGVVTFEVRKPLFGYRTIIILPFDIQEISNGKWGIFDNGGTNDIRQCEAQFTLTASQTLTLMGALRVDDDGRNREWFINLLANSGFFPFGPDKGDVGEFKIAVEIIDRQGIGPAPYKFFRLSLRFTNIGTFPSYTPPTDPDGGAANTKFKIGTVANVRFPEQWFQPDTQYADDVQILQGATAKFMNRGESGDRYTTRFTSPMTNAKCANVISYLVGTARAANFTIVTSADYFAFGRDKGGAATYTVKMISDRIEIANPFFNRFNLTTEFGYINTV